MSKHAFSDFFFLFKVLDKENEENMFTIIVSNHSPQ